MQRKFAVVFFTYIQLGLFTGKSFSDFSYLETIDLDLSPFQSCSHKLGQFRVQMPTDCCYNISFSCPSST